jgi:hypothetical protein
LGDASGAFVAALAHLTEASFPFPKIWSLYPAILGQAIPSAFGRFRLAITITFNRNASNIISYFRIFKENFKVSGHNLIQKSFSGWL